MSLQQAKVSTATIWHFYIQCINLRQAFPRFIRSTALAIITETISTQNSVISGFLGFSQELCSCPQEKGRTTDYISSCTLVWQTRYFKSGKKPNKQNQTKPTILYILPISDLDLPGISSILYTAECLNRDRVLAQTDCFLCRYA